MKEVCFQGGIIKVVLTFAMLTLRQDVSHCSGFIIHSQMTLYKVITIIILIIKSPPFFSRQNH